MGNDWLKDVPSYRSNDVRWRPAIRIPVLILAILAALALVASAIWAVPTVIGVITGTAQSAAMTAADKVMPNLGSIKLEKGTLASPLTTSLDKSAICGKNYVFLGVDSRAGMDSDEVLSGTDTGMRSDTQMLFNTNADCSQSNLVSIMRDYWVPIPCRGNIEAKFNAAFSAGGVQCAVDTIKQTISVDPSNQAQIEGVAVIDFAGFEEAIDLIGCIDFTSDVSFTTSNMKGFEVQAGTHQYCGEAALAIARERYAFDISDYARIQLQRQIMFSAFDKLSAMSEVDRAKTAYMLADYITTSEGMGVEKLLALFEAIRGTEWNQGVLPTAGTGWANNGDGLGNQSVVLVDQRRLQWFNESLKADTLATYLKDPENQKHW